MPVVLALCAAVVYGVSDYCGGRAARTVPAYVVTLVAQLASAGATAVLVAVVADPFPGAPDVAWSTAAGLASTVAITAFYHALANGAMTVVAPTTAIVSAIVPVGIGFALGERPSAVAIVGVGVAIVAVALVSGLGGRAERPTPPVIAVVAVLAGAGFGLLFVFLDRTTDESGLWPIFLAQLAALPVMATVVVVRRTPFPPPPHVVGVMAAAGVLGVTANVSYLVATREGLLSLVAVITSMYPASTVVLATVLDRERMSSSQAVGLGLAVGALALVAFGS